MNAIRKTKARRKPPSLQALYDRERRDQTGNGGFSKDDFESKRFRKSHEALCARPFVWVADEVSGAAVPVAQDTDILAMMVQTRIITTRQQDALSRLAELYWGWKSRQKVTTGYGGVKGGSGGVSEHVEAAYRRYNALMAHVPKDCKHAVAVAASGDMPVFACSMELLRRGATALADHLQLAKETGTTS